MSQSRFIAALSALAAALLAAPLLGLVARVDARMLRALFAPNVIDAAGLSILCATVALGLAIVVGTPLAIALHRARGLRHRALQTLVLVPLVLPPVVSGVGLLTAFGRTGLLGAPLASMGVQLSFTTASAILAASFVSAPFYVVTLSAALARRDRAAERAALALGASARQVALHVTLPALRPAVVAGASLCLARALGEFGATMTFAGNIPGRTQTLPLLVYETLQTDPDHAVAVALLLLVFALIPLLLTQMRAP